MKIEIRSDKTIDAAKINAVTAAVDAGLSRYESRLTRAEVHLKNADESHSGEMPSCTLEVRPAGRDPVTVHDHAGNVGDAIDGAIGKMERLLDSLFDRLDDPRGPSASGLPT